MENIFSIFGIKVSELCPRLTLHELNEVIDTLLLILDDELLRLHDFVLVGNNLILQFNRLFVMLDSLVGIISMITVHDIIVSVNSCRSMILSCLALIIQEIFNGMPGQYGNLLELIDGDVYAIGIVPLNTFVLAEHLLREFGTQTLFRSAYLPESASHIHKRKC